MMNTDLNQVSQSVDISSELDFEKYFKFLFFKGFRKKDSKQFEKNAYECNIQLSEYNDPSYSSELVLGKYFEFNFGEGLRIVEWSLSSELDFEKYLEFHFFRGVRSNLKQAGKGFQALSAMQELGY